MIVLRVWAGILVASSLGVGICRAAPRPAPLFSEGMVLQQMQPIPVWGESSPGESVTVKFLGQEVTTQADAGGRWKVALAPVTATTNQPPAILTLVGRDTKGVVSETVIRNVLVGEVWLCSGQSNMSRPVSTSLNPEAEQAAANYPGIRMFTVAERATPLPQETCGGNWEVCSPETVGMFSGVGYFFARKIHQELGIPVGMIHASVGGTAINSWTPLEALKASRAGLDAAQVFEKDRAVYLADTNKYGEILEAGKKKREAELAAYDARVFSTDVGHVEGWAKGSTGSGEWKATDMPLSYSVLGNFCGSAWCRRTVTISSHWVGRALNFNFGSVDEADEVYVNGVRIGETHDNGLWQTPRHYIVPASVVTNTELLVVVRVMNQVGAMGVGGIEADFSLLPVDAKAGEEGQSLARGWTYAMGSPLSFSNRPIPDSTTVPGIGINPSTLYNAMIAPLAPFAVKGTLWYQGEADAGEWQAYTELLPTMIGAWRTAWGQPSFCFLIVQIANYMPPQPNAIEFNSCADIRDVQRKALSIPETGLAVALDTGNTDNYDGHPRNKQDVGLRLALWALNKTYGRGDVVPSGPLYRSIKIEKDRVVVAFDYVGGGLTVRGSALDGFAIAGPDKVFYKARAEIKGDTVVVWSDKVPEPSAVRYAWATNPSSTLYNKEGLPASSFRTDDWAAAKCAP